MRCGNTTRRTALAAAAAVLVSGLAACSSSPSRPPTLAQSIAACHRKPATVHPQDAKPSGPPGTILWSVLTNRCQGAPTYNVWGADETSTQQEGELVPGGKLVLAQDGMVSAYNTATGARLWQDTVVSPSLSPTVTQFEATSSLVLAGFLTNKSSAGRDSGRLAFLDTANGHLINRAGTGPSGDSFLVGSHVVVNAGHNVLEGYDPASGRTLWRQTVPDAPHDQGVLEDGSTIYLSSVKPSGAEDTMRQSQLLRIDAASGHRLLPLPLPRRANVAPESIGGNGFAQGLLLLDVTGTNPNSAAEAITNTIAIDAATGHTAWIAADDVNAAPAGLFTVLDQGAHSLTGVNPKTGKQLWTISAPELGDLGGPDPLLAQPGALVATEQAAPRGPVSQGKLVGLNPGSSGRTAWASPGLPDPLAVDNSESVVYATTCQPWPGSNGSLCADQQLLAIAV